MAKSVTRWWALLVAMILGIVSKGGIAQNATESDFQSVKAELQAFEDARAKNTEAAYRDFLRRYPEGQFTAEAFRDLVSAVVKSERPIFEPAFDNQLLIEGLMPAPLEPTLTATTTRTDESEPAPLPAAATASEIPTITAPAAPTVAPTRARGSIASRLIDPY